jgi:hypothetical protein
MHGGGASGCGPRPTDALLQQGMLLENSIARETRLLIKCVVAIVVI